MAHGVDNCSRRRHDAEHDHRSAVDDRFAVDEHLVFAVAAVDRVDVDGKVPPQSRRRTDGVKARDSKGAVATGDSSHIPCE